MKIIKIWKKEEMIKAGKDLQWLLSNNNDRYVNNEKLTKWTK